MITELCLEKAKEMIKTLSEKENLTYNERQELLAALRFIATKWAAGG